MFKIFFKITLYSLLFSTFITCNKEIPPNVIFILTDDQGYGDLGIYGASDIITPNIDSIAKKGHILPLIIPHNQFVLPRAHLYSQVVTQID